MNITKPQTTRTVEPQWIKGKNLGEYKVNTIELTGPQIVDLATRYPEAMAEKLNAQCGISFNGPTITGAVYDALVAEHGKPEKGKRDEWKAAHYDAAVKLAAAEAEKTLDYAALLGAWCREWKPAGASGLAALKSKAAGLSAEEKAELIASLQ